jgi:TRAP-type C4-dicarboxylate transport system substrate-binding protein
MLSPLRTFALAATAIALSAGAASSEPLLIKLATVGPPNAYFYVDTLQPWADAVSRDSQGTVEIKMFAGGVLGNNRTMYDMVTSGTADIGFTGHGQVAANFPKSTVAGLPFLYETGEEAATAFWRVYANGLIADEYKNLKLFGLNVYPAAVLATRSPVQKIEDLKGLKLAVPNKRFADISSALGAVPVNIIVTELYQALDRGTVNGTATPIAAVRSFRLNEVTKYWLDTPFAGGSDMVIMARAKYDSLPAAAKAAFEKHSGEALSRALGKSHDREVERTRQFLAEQAAAGKVAPIQKLSVAETARWEQVIRPVVDEWMKDTPNGPAVHKGFAAAIADVRAGK